MRRGFSFDSWLTFRWFKFFGFNCGKFAVPVFLWTKLWVITVTYYFNWLLRCTHVARFSLKIFLECSVHCSIECNSHTTSAKTVRFAAFQTENRKINWESACNQPVLSGGGLVTCDIWSTGDINPILIMWFWDRSLKVHKHEIILNFFFYLNNILTGTATKRSITQCLRHKT